MGELPDELLHDRRAERYLKTILVTSPAAGATWTFTAPGGDILILLQLRARLVTDANVANRRPALTLTDGTTEFFRINTLTSQVAAVTGEYSYVNGLGAAWNPNTDYSLPLPPAGVVIKPGFVLGHTVANLQAGDQFSNIVLRVLDIPLRGGYAETAYEVGQADAEAGYLATLGAVGS